MQKISSRNLILFPFLIFLTAKLSAQETVIVNKLNSIIKPIKALKADGSFDDASFLAEILKKKEVIALGEVTHGTKEVFDYKDKLIRYMVSNLSYKAIAFEADYNRLAQIDSYINGTIDSIPISPEYKLLMNWLRAYNKTKNSKEDKVHVYGLELRGFSLTINKILTSNKHINQQDKELLQKIKQTPFDKIDKETLGRFRTFCVGLPQDLYKKMLIQLIDNYNNFIDINSKIRARDIFMAENAMAIKEDAPGQRLIIWAHNGHVAKTPLYKRPTMGMYLNKEYTDKYYVIATDINKGYVSVRKVIAKNKPMSNWQPIYYPEVNSTKGYEYYFKQCKFKNFILDVQEAGRDHELNLFLTKEKEMRMIGGLSTPVNKRLSIANNFDMIIYFNETNSI
ncbi:MAG: erythromycin esterase family protein [Bacteroidota bacterium]